MKKTTTNKDLMRYTAQIYSGVFAGMLLLAAIASCAGFAGTMFELGCILLLSLMSSSFCFLASENI